MGTLQPAPELRHMMCAGEMAVDKHVTKVYAHLKADTAEYSVTTWTGHCHKQRTMTFWK